MRFTRSLRTRVAVAFAAIGGSVSLIIAVGLYIGVQDAGERLIDETLNAEMQDYLARRARNPHSLPPATNTLLGFVSSSDPGEPAPPGEFASRSVGRGSVQLNGTSYRLMVSDHAGSRYYLLHNETLFHQKQIRLAYFLAVFVALMALVSAGVALWLAERVIEPVKELARRVREVGPETPHGDLSADFPHDELGELAHAFEQSLRRLAAFIDRERAFTADVSHELRTPLAVIRGAAEVLLTDTSRPAKERQRIERIEHAAADMADLSTALLAMAREQDDGKFAAADVAALVEETMNKHRHLLSSGQVRVELEILARPRLSADPNLLVIVIANLVRNSFTYTQHGEVRVCVAATTLTVSDTGVGIPRDALDKVFQRHYKGEASAGFGIGLALVKKICDRYGWSISLSSEAGKGTEAVLNFSPRSI